MWMAGVLLIMPANGLLTGEAQGTAEPNGAAANGSYTAGSPRADQRRPELEQWPFI